ncbi:MAG: amidohydrolase [Eubacteriales bacterium]|nr:amidohydrolase [Eubacteriales bacterium]
MYSWIEQECEQLKEEVIMLRRDFHAHPELGTKEVRTSEIVEKYLNDLGIPTRRAFHTGVIGLLEGGKPGKCLLLRADMDALPVQEENDVPYCSTVDGVMHACGHDGHTAMLLVAAKILAKHKDVLAGSVKFVFQPNEEESGAIPMVAEGALENPPVNASFAMHLWSSIPSGTIGLNAGPVMGEMYNFRIHLEGLSAHSSTPSKGVDAILCAADIIQTAQVLQTREIDPIETTCLSFGKIEGGTMSNIIADHVDIEGCMRYLYDGSNDGPQHPRKRLERIVTSISEAYRVKSEITFFVSNYVLINDEKMVEFAQEHVASNLREVEKVVPYVTMAGEDFSEFSSHSGIPGVFMFVGIGNHDKGTDFPHHNNHFNIDEDMLPVGVKAHVLMATEFLK